MSKSSTSSKIPPQLPSKSAWAKGPPQSSRSESPAPTHSRRPSAAIGQAVPIKDGVSIPRNNVGSVKNGSSVTFGSIDDASAPISSSPAATPAVKPVDAVKSFGSVPNEVNGTTKPVNLPTKLQKADIKKLFQTPTSTGGPSTPSESSSPAPRPVSLPPQTPTPQPSSFTQNGARSQQPPSGAPPRSPQYSRQLPNGNGGRNGPPSGLSSPRLAPITHTGQPAGMTPQPPPQMTSMPPPPTMWPPYYYIDPNYLQYGQPWPYGMPQPMPQQQPPQQQPHMAPHPGMPVSPRNPPPPLQGPGTPTPAHAVPATHSPHPSNIPHSSSTNISGLSSPPPTPSTSTSGGRLDRNAQAFVPTRPTSKIILKSADGVEVNIAELKSKSVTTTSSPATSAASLGSASPKRKSVIRIETPEDKAKRVAEEKEAARLKAESEEKAKKAKEEQERKAQEEQERKEKEVQEQKKKEEEARIRKEQEETERERKMEAELKERLRKEEEERKRKEEEEAAAAEKERLRKEEEKERLKKEEEAQKRREEEKRKRQEEEEQKRQEEERVRKEEERALKEKEEVAVATKVTEPLEEGELVEEGTSESASAKEQEKKDKANLRINTAPASPHTSEVPRRRPGPLDLSTAKGPVAPPLPSALATARIIEDIKTVQYPEGIKSPRIELNANAKDGKFRYDREFLLQFMAICKDKPDSLPPLDAIGLEPSDFPITRGGSRSGGVRDRTPSTSHPAGVPFPGKGGNVFPPIGIGKFATMPGRPQDPTRSISVSGAGPGFARPSQMQRTTSQTGRDGRVRSQRGGKRVDQKQAGQQTQGSAFQPGLANPPLDYIPLQTTANRWDRKALIADTETPEYVDRKVKSLLNKLTMEKFDPISDQIVTWANKSEKEKDGRTLIQVIRLVFEKATDEATWSEMYARLCRKMMETISSKVQDDGIKNNEGKPIAGGQLFRKYLLNRCQEDFERGWAAKEATAAAAASKGEADAKIAEKEGTEEAELYSEEYYAAQKAKRQGLGLIKFIGELFKLQMLTERIMHECIKKLLGNVENPEEEEIESLCKLLTTVGSILDTNKARAHMDVYFSRMKELTKSGNVSSRMQFMLQDVIELRERKWISRNAVAAPTTIAAVHELAAREGQANSFNQRTISMSRGGSKRGAERGEYQQAGPDGWTTAGPTSTPRPPTKAGDLSKFGQITKSSTPATFGPASVFSNKNKEGKKELQRTSSSSNMFSMLSSNAEAAAEPKGSRPPSRKTSVDFSQTGGVPPDGPPQRRRLMLQPRSKPVEQEPTPASQEAESSEGEEEEEESVMTDEQAKKKIEEDTKEFFAVRSLEEAEVYFSKLPTVHHAKLIDKLVSLALESKEADAQLVADFFDIASSKELCTLESFEAGYSGCMEFLDDVAIDAPKAPAFMAIMLKGPPFDDEQLARLAAKSEENGPSLLSP